MILLTFLDDAPYPKSVFQWHNRRYRGRFATAAIARQVKPAEIVVFTTELASSTVFHSFTNEIQADMPVRKVIIPAGKNEEEMWAIAQLINHNIPDHATISFDLSNGPLSYPMIGLMTIFYLRLSREIEIQAVLYAAQGIDETPPQREQHQPGGAEQQIPIFDLSPMLTWLEWYSAVERFNRTGEFSRLDRLFQKKRRELGRSVQNDPGRLAEIGSLGKLAGVTRSISRSLIMIRPHQVMQLTSDLPDRIESVEPLFQEMVDDLTYRLLQERLLSNFIDLGMPEPDKPESTRHTVATERKLINWYAERGLWVEAITLAREWVVNWVILKLEQTDLRNRRLRMRIENALGAEAQDLIACKRAKQPYTALFLGDITELEQVLALWLELTEVRNDINHAGMRERPGQPDDLINRSKACIDIVNKLPVG